MRTVAPRWELQDCDMQASAELANELGVPPVVARLLWQRGLADPQAAGRFLNPSLDQLHDPMRLADMGIAVDRLNAAIASRERIAIHGDYDVDGITATVILRRALELLGADVGHFIPERVTRRLWPAAGDDRPPEGRGGLADRVGGLRDPQRGSRAARA